MRILSNILDLITSDPLTLGATAVLAIAIVGLLLVISWPASDVPPTTAQHTARSTAARSLAAAGLQQIEIARRTGLSRDGLTLLLNAPTRGTRQMPPHAAGTSLFSRLRGRRPPVPPGPQVAA
jgi:hypothetical protein